MFILKKSLVAFIIILLFICSAVFAYPYPFEDEIYYDGNVQTSISSDYTCRVFCYVKNPCFGILLIYDTNHTILYDKSFNADSFDEDGCFILDQMFKGKFAVNFGWSTYNGESDVVICLSNETEEFPTILIDKAAMGVVVYENMYIKGVRLRFSQNLFLGFNKNKNAKVYIDDFFIHKRMFLGDLLGEGLFKYRKDKRIPFFNFK